MADYKTNTTNNLPEKRVEKAVTTTAITKKKSTVQRLSEEFISDDAKNIKSYVFGDVLIPALKKAISDIVTNSIDMLLYGDSRPNQPKTTASKISYRNYWDDRRTVNEPRTVSSYSYNYEDVVLATKGEAVEVLDRMDELIAAYGVVRVADLYDLVGKPGNYTDNRYGWINIKNASIIRVREGYMIKMPRVTVVD